MSSNNLTNYQIKSGRKIFNIYSVLNSFSFALVTGNVITLYALFLGASSIEVGLISAFSFLSFFAIPFGKFMAGRRPLLKVFADAWMWRNWSLLLMLFIPFTVIMNAPRLGLMFLLISLLLFNFFRGIGMVANNPVISDLAPGTDRGEYIILLSSINNAAALVATLAIALLLWFLPALLAFNIALWAGIATGIVASLLLYKMPKPKHEKTITGNNFMHHFKTAIKNKNFIRYVTAFAIMGIGVGMARPFIIVYCRDVFGQSNSMITIISLFSILGALAMGAIMRLFIVRIGAKPMYIIFTVVCIVSFIPILIVPSFSVGAFLPLFLFFIAFSTNLGFSGQESAAQAYFFSIIPSDAVMDLSIVYYFIFGGTGAVGSLFGGVFFDLLRLSGYTAVTTYRIYYVIQIIIIALALIFQARLQRMGSVPLRNTIGMFFSPRDLRALNLLYRLDHSENSKEETELLAELKESTTQVAATKLLQRLSSPRFAVRFEALNSMEHLPSLPPEAVPALLDELLSGVFTTAHQAARILGTFRIVRAHEALCTALHSTDFVLAGEAMVALARLGDTRAQMIMSEILIQTHNQHMLLWGIHAMELYNNEASLPIMLDILRLDYETDVVHHEALLALSTVLGFEKRFYQPYSRYIADPLSASEIISDLYDEAASHKKVKGNDVLELILSFLKQKEVKEDFVKWINTAVHSQKSFYATLLMSAVLDSDLTRLDSFRFFTCFWAISVLDDTKLLVR